MRTAIVPSHLISLLVMASMSACSSSEGDSGADIPEFTATISGTEGAVVPGVPGPSPDAVANPGVSQTPAGNEGQGTPPLATTPGTPAPSEAGAPNVAPPVAGTEPPFAGTEPPPADPATPPAPIPSPASFFTSGAWRGPVRPVAVLAGTTVNPTSFDNRAEGEPFCIEGSVANDVPMSYRGVAQLVFTLDQPDGSAPQAVVPQAEGLAFNFTRTTGSLVRVVLQPPASAAGESAEGWCYAIPEVRGQIFVPYSEFRVGCFNRPPGAAYAREPIEAISFNSPGSDQLPIAYDFCVAGIADAANASQAPAAPAGFFEGDISGTLIASFERAMVLGADSRKYVVQNNGWGRNLTPNSQQVSYRNNSFTITQAPQGGGSDEPLSFPSLYVGASGFIDGNEAISTRLDDNLPIAISQIQSVQTRFAHNANNVDANATFDVWFAAQPPTAEYRTATGAFLMVWTYKPGNRNAIGNQVGTATIEGQQWQIFVGPRGSGQGATGADANAPVISYVKQGAPIPDYTFDLNAFIDDAVASGRLNGNLFLTDVFAGFEIWSGGQGLSVTNFTVDVQGG
jgi:Glycosyl hydrolase family 12